MSLTIQRKLPVSGLHSIRQHTPPSNPVSTSSIDQFTPSQTGPITQTPGNRVLFGAANEDPNFITGDLALAVSKQLHDRYKETIFLASDTHVAQINPQDPYNHPGTYVTLFSKDDNDETYLGVRLHDTHVGKGGYTFFRDEVTDHTRFRADPEMAPAEREAAYQQLRTFFRNARIVSSGDYLKA